VVRILLSLSLAACLPPDAPVEKPAAPDPVVHDWKIVEHVLAGNAAVNDADADVFHGRIVSISAAGYTTPWHGLCDEAGRQRRNRSAGDVSAEVGIPAARFASLGASLVEIRFTCTDNKRVPALTMWFGGDRAVSCWNGACYVLAK
jgi:hypothetical protein